MVSVYPYLLSTTGPLWRAHFQEAKLHDNRRKRKDLMITTDDKPWAKIVRVNESIIVFDTKTRQIVLIVIRNF
jgi:hypothetical protein